MRLLEFDDRLTPEMVGRSSFCKADFYADRRRGIERILIEGEKGEPAAVMTYRVLDVPAIIAGIYTWVHPDYRGGTYVLDAVNEAKEEHGVTVAISEVPNRKVAEKYCELGGSEIRDGIMYV